MEEEKVQTKDTKNISISFGIVIVVAIAVIALIVILANSTKDYKKVMAGAYNIIGMKEGDTEYTEDKLINLKELGLIRELEIKEDGTGLLTISEKKEEFIYDKKEMTFKVKVDKEEKEEKVPYTFEKNKISFEKEGAKFIFEKIEK